jgi:hypothetical protein
MNTELSPKMLEAVDHMKRHNNTMVRFPGGYWAAIGWYAWHGPCWGTPTIEALVRRGIAEYTAWKEVRGGKFPIKAKLREQKAG